MILPDIRKCSNSVQNMIANRYSCFWSLGAIWQPLWIKNSHNMAIFPHFLTFSVTFLVAMTTFMHKTSTERTKTFLIHRTIDEYTFFAFFRHLYKVPDVQKWPIWDQKWPNMAGLPMPRCGPKGSQMVPNGQYNIFLTIWDIFGLIWTLLDLLRQKFIFCLKNTKCFLVKAVSSKNQLLSEIVQKGPNDPKKVPNGQKYVILTIWDHLGPFWTTSGHWEACHVKPFLVPNGPFLDARNPI